MSNCAGSDKPSAVLKAEHQVILRVVGVLQRLVARARSGDGFEAESFARCVEFARFFADACHHAKEEDLLFPAMESRGIPKEDGPIACMLHEHTLARALTKEMADGLESAVEDSVLRAAMDYVELLTNHIYKEDNILFDMGDQVLTADDQNTLCGKFCEVECKSFGGKKREQLEAIADELEAKWPN